MVKKRRSLFARLKRKFIIYASLVFFIWSVYYILWERHAYIVTAYCNCPICINVKEYYDGKFASGKGVYWGGIAADPHVAFGTKVELVPLFPQDWFSVAVLLQGRRNFIVEDRGGKIKGKHVDLFIPDLLGGHQTAKLWGNRKMRLKINDNWAE